jgi:hypothetical protein
MGATDWFSMEKFWTLWPPIGNQRVMCSAWNLLWAYVVDVLHGTYAHHTFGVLRRTIGLLMFCTTKIYFSRIVLEPGVNIKIFSGCAHKKDIYKFHTTGPPKSVSVSPRD